MGDDRVMPRHVDPARVLATALIACIACACSSSYTPRAGRRLSVVMSGGQLAYVRDGAMIEHGLFGGGLEDAVRGVPAAEEAARTHHHRTVGGFLVGMGGFVCSMIATGAAAQGAESGDDIGTEIGLSFGCLGAALVGFIVMATGMPYMYDAINLYNDSVEVTPPYLPMGAPGAPGSQTR